MYMAVSGGGVDQVSGCLEGDLSFMLPSGLLGHRSGWNQYRSRTCWHIDPHRPRSQLDRYRCVLMMIEALAARLFNGARDHV